MPSTDLIQITLTLKVTAAQVVDGSVNVNSNSPIQENIHPDDHIQPTCEIRCPLVLMGMV